MVPRRSSGLAYVQGCGLEATCCRDLPQQEGDGDESTRARRSAVASSNNAPPVRHRQPQSPCAVSGSDTMHAPPLTKPTTPTTATPAVRAQKTSARGTPANEAPCRSVRSAPGQASPARPSGCRTSTFGRARSTRPPRPPSPAKWIRHRGIVESSTASNYRVLGFRTHIINVFIHILFICFTLHIFRYNYTTKKHDLSPHALIYISWGSTSTTSRRFSSRRVWRFTICSSSKRIKD
jgi:hypothetical protein